jgi:hypothetical protein
LTYGGIIFLIDRPLGRSGKPRRFVVRIQDNRRRWYRVAFPHVRSRASASCILCNAASAAPSHFVQSSIAFRRAEALSGFFALSQYSDRPEL